MQSLGNDSSPVSLPQERPQPSENYLLHVTVKVPRSLPDLDGEFHEKMREGLVNGYSLGQRRQLGIVSRPRRSLSESPKADNHVQVKITSKDRVNSQLAKVRFYMLIDDKLVKAVNAKQTFDELSLRELSALITYPVVEPVRTSLDGKQWSTVAYATLGLCSFVLLLIFLAICIVCCLKKKNRKGSVGPSPTPRKQLPADDVSVLGDFPPPGRPYIDPTNKTVVEVPASPELSERGPMELPPIRKEQLLRDFSPRDDSETSSCLELFDHLNPPPKSRFSSNKVSPMLPSESFTLREAEDEAGRVFLVSPRSRQRATAKRLLDKAFPLTATSGAMDNIVKGNTFRYY